MQEKIQKLRELKLLFVEDEEDLITIIEDTLTKLQSNFLTARNGEEALKVLENHPDIDAVITDINMPLMNGIELIEQMNQKGLTMPVIVMSAHTEAEYLEKAKALGVKNYLLKPFDFIKFIDLIVTMGIK
ncbi:MAG: response regulator [Arcobacteraceae bacterium]|jgi:YesN/AraC family two-component response regulator|nr:response regulator [Arcobacteraceae bacterium]MDX9795537.1 response regulator [Arcobacteraceae bacterium]